MLERITAWLAGDASENLVASHFGFNAPLPAVMCVALVIGAAVLTAVFYWRRLTAVTTPMRVLLVALRTAAVTIIVFLVLDPSIIAQHIKPGEQFVVLLFDDSKSMRLVGQDGESRADRFVKAYQAAEDSFEGVLRQKNQLARYRVGGAIEPIQSIDDLKFEQRESDLTGAVQSSLMDMEGTSVSAVVLFSDGVQQTSNDPVSIADIPQTAPVFTVGVDTASDWRDIEVGDISVKRTDFDQSPVVINADIHSTGLAGRQAMVEALLGTRVVKSKLIDITDESQDHEVRLEYIPDRDGWLEYAVEVRLMEGAVPAVEGAAGLPDERIKENNVKRFVVDNREKQYRILYVSARPNWEHKFIRRALTDDDSLKLTSLICISNAAPKFTFHGKDTAIKNPLFEGFDEDEDRPRYDEAVYLRIGATEQELVSGFPVLAEELYQYSLVIFGDVEREMLTAAQLELSRDYVEKRGGNLLLMGGPKSFTESQFSGSIIESMLPVVLFTDSDGPEASKAEGLFSVEPTMEGFLAGSWSFHNDAGENERMFTELPQLYGLERFPVVRPGATVMAEVASGTPDLEGRPLYLMQRYGEGRCAVLATSDTWQWQMRLTEEDDRHERIWRQIVRNLVHDTPEAAYLRGKADTYTQGEPADFEFIVRDKIFERREALRVTVNLKTPSGEETPLSVDESIEEAGLYTSSFTPEDTGLYTMTLSALNDKDEAVATLDEAILVEPDQREFQQAQYDDALLKELASTSSGEHYSLDRLGELAESIPVPQRDDAEQVWLHLWHLPGFYVVVVAMLIAEWYFRRKKGQP